MNNINCKHYFKKLPLVFVFIFVIIQISCDSDDGDSTSSNQPVTHKVSISAGEVGSAIYIDGVYTGRVTPSEITLKPGEHVIGIGLKKSRQYLRKNITVKSETTTLNITLTNDDLQQPKTWKALFIGVNKVYKIGGTCISEYTTEELDKAYEFFNWSFKEQVEDYSYHTTKWEVDRRDISNDTITLSSENLITPNIIDAYITDINKGDYDLIVTFFRGGAGTQENCFIDNFLGLAWFDVTELNSDASYYTIRYYDDVESVIDNALQNDPGMFIHEWLHTTAEMFYPNRGEKVPSDNGQVVHAAGKYKYTYPWMTWYKDLISGQVKDGVTYSGIGPDAFLECTVRESALGNCPNK